jgi:hypothetical protein
MAGEASETAMERASEPMPEDVRVQYLETYAAIDRMRQHIRRGNSLEQGAAAEDEFNDEVDAAGDQGD